jgi:hypothetical protein
MKSIFAVLPVAVIVSAMLTLVGCGRQNNQDNVAATPNICMQNPAAPGCSNQFYGAYPTQPQFAQSGCQGYYGNGWAPTYNGQVGGQFGQQQGFGQQGYGYNQNPQACINYQGIQGQYGYNMPTQPYYGGQAYSNCVPGGANTCFQGFCRPIGNGMGVCGY